MRMLGRIEEIILRKKKKFGYKCRFIAIENITVNLRVE